LRNWILKNPWPISFDQLLGKTMKNNEKIHLK
jgi:hypothetical protein